MLILLLQLLSKVAPASENNKHLQRYSDLLAKNCKLFLPPSHLVPSLEMSPFEFLEKLYGS